MVDVIAIVILFLIFLVVPLTQNGLRKKRANVKQGVGERREDGASVRLRKSVSIGRLRNQLNGPFYHPGARAWRREPPNLPNNAS
jgi:hypothetical protein